jgi:hypothetical protein
MVEYFKPFLRHLLARNLSRKTLHQHRDNIWVLGGEVLMTPLKLQTGPKTSAKSGCCCSMREKRRTSGRSLVSGIVGIRSYSMQP